MTTSISSRNDPAIRPGSVKSAKWWVICSATGQPSFCAFAAWSWYASLSSR
jgi:hypothetical protein